MGTGIKRRGPIVLGLGLIGLLAVVGVVGLLVVHPWSADSKGTPPQLFSPSLDPDAPAFPVPTGSSLVNAQIVGSGPAAYRIAAWHSALDYEATVSFYANLTDSRWHATGAPLRTLHETDVTFSDGQGVFSSAQLEIDPTDPVLIEVRFMPAGGVPQTSIEPGPTVVFRPMPTASALPSGFPAAFVPPGMEFVDGACMGTTCVAIFRGTVDLTAYENQIRAAAQITSTQEIDGSTVIGFTYHGNAGQAVWDPADGELTVEVTS